ncbi:MAG TPA: hypothetical protein VIK91_06495 [Nannocystis sp.]
MPDEPRTDLERRALAALPAAEPPPDFPDRVLAALAAAEQRPAAPARPRANPFALAAPRLAGLWFIHREGGKTIAWHPGGVEGYNATIARFLDDGITVFALANTEAIDTRTIVYDVALIVGGATVEPPLEHEEVRLAPAQHGRYLGRYVLSETSRRELTKFIDPVALVAIEQVRVVRRGDRLVLDVPEHVGKWMHFLGEDRFFFKDPAGTTAEFGPPGAPVSWLVLKSRQAGVAGGLQQSELRFVFRRAGN